MSITFEDILCGNTKPQNDFLLHIEEQINNDKKNYPKFIFSPKSHLDEILGGSGFEPKQIDKIYKMFENSCKVLENHKVDFNFLTYKERSLLFDRTLQYDKYKKTQNIPIGIINKKIEVFTANIVRLTKSIIPAGNIIQMGQRNTYVPYYLRLSKLDYTGKAIHKPRYINYSKFCKISTTNF